MIKSGATLSLSPWAHEALSLDEMTELGKRAVDMHVRLGVLGSRYRGWTIWCDSWAKDPTTKSPVHSVKTRRQSGHLADLMHGAMDRYQREFAFTADELVTIANQSGIEVTRA